jgi:hypothetical protein
VDWILFSGNFALHKLPYKAAWKGSPLWPQFSSELILRNSETVPSVGPWCIRGFDRDTRYTLIKFAYQTGLDWEGILIKIYAIAYILCKTELIKHT